MRGLVVHCSGKPLEPQPAVLRVAPGDLGAARADVTARQARYTTVHVTPACGGEPPQHSEASAEDQTHVPGESTGTAACLVVWTATRAAELSVPRSCFKFFVDLPSPSELQVILDGELRRAFRIHLPANCQYPVESKFLRDWTSVLAHALVPAWSNEEWSNNAGWNSALAQQFTKKREHLLRWAEAVLEGKVPRPSASSNPTVRAAELVRQAQHQLDGKVEYSGLARCVAGLELLANAAADEKDPVEERLVQLLENSRFFMKPTKRQAFYWTHLVQHLLSAKVSVQCAGQPYSGTALHLLLGFHVCQLQQPGPSAAEFLARFGRNVDEYAPDALRKELHEIQAAMSSASTRSELAAATDYPMQSSTSNSALKLKSQVRDASRSAEWLLALEQGWEEYKAKGDWLGEKSKHWQNLAVRNPKASDVLALCLQKAAALAEQQAADAVGARDSALYKLAAELRQRLRSRPDWLGFSRNDVRIAAANAVGRFVSEHFAAAAAPCTTQECAHLEVTTAAENSVIALFNLTHSPERAWRLVQDSLGGAPGVQQVVSALQQTECTHDPAFNETKIALQTLLQRGQREECAQARQAAEKKLMDAAHVFLSLQFARSCYREVLALQSTVNGREHIQFVDLHYASLPAAETGRNQKTVRI